MPIRVVYVAGKITDPRGTWFEEQHTREAEAVAVELWRLGFAVVCPHTNTRGFGGVVSYEQFMVGDFEIIRRCDAVVTVPNWLDSGGAKREVALAREQDIPVYHWPADRYVLTLLGGEWASAVATEGVAS